MNESFGRGIFAIMKPKRVNIKLIDIGSYSIYTRDYRIYKQMYDSGGDFTFIYDVVYSNFIPRPFKFRIKK